MADNLKYSRLVATSGSFEEMVQHFGVVTVMNAKVYETSDLSTMKLDGTMSAGAILAVLNAATPLATLDTLKIANATQEGPTKTITGGQYANPLIKFGKSMRLEMQDALGRADALDALCGTVSEMQAASGALEYTKVHAIHVTEDFNSVKTIVGDTFFISQTNGQQIPVKIIFYQFLPDSIFNLTQDAEGDATVFDMNGDLLTSVIGIHDIAGNLQPHGTFYSIIDPAETGAA
jgi:hypothetical protein